MTCAGLLLPVALKDGLPVLISEIPAEDIGKNCGCVCPNCGGPLIAKAGPFRQHHFAHVNVDCSYHSRDATRIGLIHIAESILRQEMKLRLPGYSVSDDRVESFRDDPEIYFELIHRFQASRPEMATFDEVRLERESTDMDPILVVETASGRIAVDIVINRRICCRLPDLPANERWAMVEIDLGRAGYSDRMDRNRLRTLLIHDTRYKRWLHHPRHDTALCELIQANDSLVQEVMGRRKAP